MSRPLPVEVLADIARRGGRRTVVRTLMRQGAGSAYGAGVEPGGRA